MTPETIRPQWDHFHVTLGKDPILGTSNGLAYTYCYTTDCSDIHPNLRKDLGPKLIRKGEEKR